MSGSIVLLLALVRDRRGIVGALALSRGREGILGALGLGRSRGAFWARSRLVETQEALGRGLEAIVAACS